MRNAVLDVEQVWVAVEGLRVGLGDQRLEEVETAAHVRLRDFARVDHLLGAMQHGVRRFRDDRRVGGSRILGSGDRADEKH